MKLFNSISDFECGSEGMKSFTSSLDSQREEIFKTVFPKDYSEKYPNFEDIIELRTGEYCCKVKNVQFNFLLQRKESHQLIVFFNGALGYNQNQKKKYQRWSWSNLIDASVLNILDPLYFENENLPIGWYWGSTEINYREVMADLIKSIANEIGVKYSDIILYGSSAGGTAAMYTAHYIDGCTAVAMNAQIRPWKHEWHDKFVSILGIDTQSKDELKRNDIEWHIRNSPNCNYILIYNCRSRADFNFQLVPLSQLMDFDIKYGISKCKNIYTWVWDSGNKEKHSYLDYPAVFIAICEIVNRVKNKEPLMNIKKEVLLINEFWRDHWELYTE